jgi:hypothetical protein
VGYLSERLRTRLRRDDFPAEFIDNLDRSDFSSGRLGVENAWAQHNERVHVGIVLMSEQIGFHAALELAEVDWRDLLVSAGLADETWCAQLEDWFSRPKGQ